MHTLCINPNSPWHLLWIVPDHLDLLDRTDAFSASTLLKELMMIVKPEARHLAIPSFVTLK